MLAVTADTLYGAFVATGALSAVVPAVALRWDVQQRPDLPPDLDTGSTSEQLARLFEGLAANRRERDRIRWTGPLPTVKAQLEFLLSAASARAEQAQHAELTRIFGSAPPPWSHDVWVGPVRVPVPDEQVRLLDDEATLRAVASCPDPETADRVADLAGRMMHMVNEVVGARGFDPQPLKQAVLTVLVRAERVRHMTRAPNWNTGVTTFGETHDPQDDPPELRPWETLRLSLRETSGLIDALLALRFALFEVTDAMLKAAVTIGGVAAVRVAEAASHAPGELPEDGIFYVPAQWDLWRRRHGLWFEQGPPPDGA
jgi:hypothetical protein